jgi:hypothetical protein
MSAFANLVKPRAVMAMIHGDARAAKPLALNPLSVDAHKTEPLTDGLARGL